MNKIIDLSLHENEKSLEQKNRISKDMFGIDDFLELTLEQRKELNNVLDEFKLKEFQKKVSVTQFQREMITH